MDAGSIVYEVDIETREALEASEKVSASLDRMDKRLNNSDKAARSLGNSAKSAAGNMKPLASEVKRANEEVSRSVSLFGSLGALIGGAGVASIINMAESYNEMAERITMATKSIAEYELVQSRLLKNANETYRSLSEAQELFIRTSSSVQSLGYTLEETLDITDSFTLSLVKNAASVQRGEAATSAFSKALVSNKVAADQWETITTAMPTIIDDIAEASGKSAQQIRAMGAAGKLTGRDLTEGLKKSLDENADAAAKMATRVSDAWQNIKNNLSVYIGEANRANGSTQVISGALELLGNNINTVANALLVVGAGALAGYISSMGSALKSTISASLAARQQAASELAKATAMARSTAAALASAQAANTLTGSTVSLKAATDAHTAALARQAAAQTATRGAMAGMLSVIGGPVGVVALIAAAAAGFALMGDSATKAKPPVDLLSESLDKIGAATLRLRATQLQDKISELESIGSASAASAGQIEYLESQLKNFPNSAKAAEWRRALEEQMSAAEEAGTEIEVYKKRLEEVLERIEQISKAENQSANITTATGQSRIKTMENELALLKLTGVEREKLRALQAVGADATEDEKRRVQELAEEIYNLSDGLKEQTKTTNSNADAIKRLEQELVYAALSGEALANAKANASLNEFAKPEEVERVRQLSSELYKLEEINKRKGKFGGNADSYITGSSSPLSGGAFDDQYARYEQEAVLEQERYAKQLERLKEAKELEIQTNKTYQDLEAEMAQQHAARMEQIEMAKQQVLLSSAESTFGSLASMLETSQGRQSSAYKAMFAVSKGFAIAQASLNLSSAISQALADPSALTAAQKFANMAAVAAAGASLASNIASVSYGGGRLYGGPVAPGKAYRINENGAPEVYQAASGQQYMMPSSRGQVISNKDAVSQGQPQSAANIQIINNGPPVSAKAEINGDQIKIILDAVSSSIVKDGPVGKAVRGSFNVSRSSR